MAIKTYINEGSTSYHSLAFTDKDGAAVSPSALRYRVTSGTGTDLVPWETIDAGSTEIEISATVNTIGANGNKRFLTVEATHNGGDKITAELEYTIKNLTGI